MWGGHYFFPTCLVGENSVGGHYFFPTCLVGENSVGGGTLFLPYLSSRGK